VVSSPASYQLNGETRSVTLDGSGNGTARWTPGAPGAPGSGVGAARQGGYSTDVTGVAVKVSTNVLEAGCSVYVSYGIQSANPDNFLGSTFTGSTGDTCSMSEHLVPQDWITAVWTGGDPGAIATMRILGTANPPGV